MSHDFYVYTYAYPDGRVFYVGKGSKSRIMSHEADARNPNRAHTYYTHKSEIIRQIWADGGEVIKTKVQEHMPEAEAFRLEIDLIRLYGREHLTNLTDGGEGGEGGAREGAGRPHKHLPYLLVQWINQDGKRDIEFCGPALSTTVEREAQSIAAHHVGEQAQSVKIVKRFCCSVKDSDVVEIVHPKVDAIV